jgi:GT2 family glycosyltransferase
LGFSGGNNFGIEILLKQNADFILLLNNDTTVEPNFLEILVNKFESDNRTGIAAPQINYYDEPDKIWSAGGKISKIRGSGFAYSDKSERVFDKSDISVGFVSGCCMLIKRDVFINTGLFDENYYLYNEDTDFCLRTLKAGYKIYVTPKSKIYHKVNSSTNRELSLLPLYYTTRNRLYFAKKNFPQILFLTAIYLFITMLLKSLVWIIKGRYKNLIVVNNAIKDFYRGKLGKTENNIFCGN